MSPQRCPACESVRDHTFVEERRDPIGGGAYHLFRCGTCALVFCEPRDPVGPDWYEKASPLRAQEVRTPAGSDWRFRRFLDAGFVPGRLLDVGCGDGGFLQFAATRSWHGVGVDYENRMIDLARMKCLDVYARDYSDFLKSRAAKEFDAVTLFDVLEHAPEPRDLLALIKPLLKRGGHLAITFPNESRPNLFGREEYDYPPHHFTRWNPGALRNFLQQNGFEIERLEVIGPSVRWFSEILFDGLIAPFVLKLARGVLFGEKAQGTLTSLYAASAAPGAAKPPLTARLLASKSRRQSLVNKFKYACRVITYPVALVLAAFYGLRRDSGEYLFCLARYKG